MKDIVKNDCLTNGQIVVFIKKKGDVKVTINKLKLKKTLNNMLSASYSAKLGDLILNIDDRLDEMAGINIRLTERVEDAEADILETKRTKKFYTASKTISTVEDVVEGAVFVPSEELSFIININGVFILSNEGNIKTATKIKAVSGGFSVSCETFAVGDKIEVLGNIVHIGP